MDAVPFQASQVTEANPFDEEINVDGVNRVDEQNIPDKENTAVEFWDPDDFFESDNSLTAFNFEQDSDASDFSFLNDIDLNALFSNVSVTEVDPVDHDANDGNDQINDTVATVVTVATFEPADPVSDAIPTIAVDPIDSNGDFLTVALEIEVGHGETDGNDQVSYTVPNIATIDPQGRT